MAAGGVQDDLELMRLVEHVRGSFDRANENQSKLPHSVLSMEGMSGEKTRHFLNNLCAFPGARYMEVRRGGMRTAVMPL